MSADDPPLQPDSITLTQIKKCVEIYPQVVERVYTSKIRDSKKFRIALDNDKWRFDELPQEIQKSGKKGLTKEQLERLVQWKITHGQNRPFLPGMIRKNDSGQVLSATSDAFTLLSPTTNTLDITMSALSKACTLTGVGPATGTLILSVFSPDHIPFFQDEMYAWFFPDAKKLKYDRKEYETLFNAVNELRERLGGDVKAVEVEKASYVLGHFDVLEDEERGRILDGQTLDGEGEVEGQDRQKMKRERSEEEKAGEKTSTKNGTKRRMANQQKTEESKDGTGSQSRKRKKT